MADDDESKPLLGRRTDASPSIQADLDDEVRVVSNETGEMPNSQLTINYSKPEIF